MSNNKQIFFADLYGYDRQEKNRDNNEGELLITDDSEYIKEYAEEREGKGGTITEIFLKTRIIKGSPLFEHLKNGGKIEIIMK